MTNPANSVAPAAGDQDASKDLDDMRAKVQLIEADDRNASAAIDKVITFGGPAAILASLTFMKDMAPTPIAGSMRFLQLGWLSFLIGSAAGIAALMTTRRAALHLRRLFQRKIAERNSRTEPADFNEARAWNNATVILTYSGLAGFIGGAVLLAQFAIMNMPPERPQAATGVVADSSTLTKALVEECRRLKCAISFGQTYDIPPSRERPDSNPQRRNSR